LDERDAEPCCYAGEYQKLFGRRRAARGAKAYRRKGLAASARRLVDGLVAGDVTGLSVLEVGGGVGAIQAELLAAGAERATNVDLSPEWEAEAAGLIAEQGLDGRVERRVGDFVTIAHDIPAADVVVLHRVVCCYPDWRGLLGRATSKAMTAVALTFPRDRWPTRLTLGLENLLRRIRGQEFRAFVHPARAMLELVQDAGFEITSDTSDMVWRSVVLHRAA
jgi:magnesium-protoporphyrin O-methyltransferase